MEILNTIEYGKITINNLLNIVNKNRDDKIKHYQSIGMHQVGVVDEKITLKDYQGFKLGDTVTVLKKPDIWSGSGCYPLDEKYPLTDTITSFIILFKSAEHNNKYSVIGIVGVCVGIGKFGFILRELIERKLIKCDTIDLGEPDTLIPGIKIDSIQDLVIGHKYRPIKDKEYCRKDMLLQDIYNQNRLQLYTTWNYHDKNITVEFPDIEAMPGQKAPSDKILQLVDKLRHEIYIYGYDGGPGGGGGGTIDVLKTPILPGFDKEGNEFIYIKVDGLKRCFTADNIEKLFEKGEISQRFSVSEWTTITTTLKLITDKTKLPESSKWSTMRD